MVAFFAILFTGRYPRALFDFNVGVLRWTWRVGFYSLRRARHRPLPAVHARATSRTTRPGSRSTTRERLSRGLVLVKWWLLAIPQYLVVGVFAGGGSWVASARRRTGAGRCGGGLIGLLVLFAGVALLFTGRYPRGDLRLRARA